ncbi:MAG: TetR/AcrR family transcriptional regulator [Ilumatobacteraceae bacterium]|jgi:AcrR family transcriptional regulator|nr:TetR/AcrR family transcriptional regulator [Ilumatobacteraceae bacterium]
MTVRLSAPERRQQILDVALEVFGRSGYHGASMNDVAEAAGVTKPVLYQHFDSKRHLYEELIDDVGNRLLGAIAKATADAPDGKAQTERGYQAYFRWVAQDHDEFVLLFGGSMRRDDEFRDTLRRITDDAATAIAPLIAVDVDPEVQRVFAHALIGIAESASRHLVERGEQFDPDEVAHRIAGLAWAGLRSLG